MARLRTGSNAYVMMTSPEEDTPTNPRKSTTPTPNIALSSTTTHRDISLETKDQQEGGKQEETTDQEGNILGIEIVKGCTRRRNVDNQSAFQKSTVKKGKCYGVVRSNIDNIEEHFSWNSIKQKSTTVLRNFLKLQSTTELMHWVKRFILHNTLFDRCFLLDVRIFCSTSAAVTEIITSSEADVGDDLPTTNELK
jgi:hypothetical protein